MTPGYFKTAAVAVALAGSPLLAAAQTPPPVPPSHTTGIYVGVGGGITDANLDTVTWSPPAGTGWTHDTTAGAVKGFVGWRFSKYVGVEGGYYYLGKIESQYLGPGGAGSTSSTLDAWVLDAVGYLPINEYFSLIGKLGAVNAMIDTSLVGAVPANLLPVSKSRTNFMWGLGAQLDLDQRWALRAEYENFGKFGDSSTGDMRVELWSGSAMLKF
jgi:OmpA-OmpF porin, OOP family